MVKHLVRKLMSLGHLPLALVQINFNILCNAQTTRRLVNDFPGLRDLINYVRNTYMNPQGSFLPAVWNVYGRRMEQRTNNNAERHAIHPCGPLYATLRTSNKSLRINSPQQNGELRRPEDVSSGGISKSACKDFGISIRQGNATYRHIGTPWHMWCKNDSPCVGANPSPDHVKSSEVFPEEYNVFRKDRNCLGGGIFILIHKSLTAVEQPELSTDCEILWAKLKLQNRKDLNVGCFYMPHRNKHDMEQLDKSLNLLTQNGKKDCPIVLAGDFNCPHINWINHTTHSTGKDNDIQQSLVDIMQSSTLTQVHYSPTRFMNILDLIFFSNPSLVKSSVSVPGISDHEMIVTAADTRPQRTTPLAKKCFQFHKAEWSSLRTDCDSIAESVKKQADSGSTMEDL
ncbi:hypothetical protein ACOMHN_024626 [Nucella lapillus]